LKLAIISDIHANLAAMKAIEADLRAADHVICLGDFTGYYCEVNEVIDLLRELKAICVLGNHDYYVLNECPAGLPPGVQFGVAFAKATLHSEHKDWLARVPISWGGVVAGRSMLLTHGSPWRPLEDYLYADSLDLRRLKDFEFDLVAFGQTHRFFQDDIGKPLLLNPGSVGQNRDQGEEAMASAVILDGRTSAAIIRSYSRYRRRS
jgi:putative phosphoesterase